jgi:uncharacterized protein YeaO (DUF488 family)
MKASSNRLSALTKELRAQWADTKAHGKDAKSQEFEHRYMDELLASVDRTVTAMEQLDKLLNRIRTDCE